jgi:3-oxoacyl-[acyl-carrier protein] reductase
MEATNKTIIISGGTRGLGLAMTTHCLQRGCAVATFARQATKEIEAAGAAHPGRLHFEPLDASAAEPIEKFVERVAAKFGAIHGLVNNAAIGQDHLLAHIAPAMVESIITVNLTGPILLTRSVVRRMLLGGAGARIVNITSICGTRGYPGLTVYSATKGGMDAFTRSLARELGGRGILVNAIAPGFFSSAMSSVLARQQLETITRRTPTERLCTEQDILPVLDMLLFEPINQTGQTIAVDGGATI